MLPATYLLHGEHNPVVAEAIAPVSASASLVTPDITAAPVDPTPTAVSPPPIEAPPARLRESSPAASTAQPAAAAWVVAVYLCGVAAMLIRLGLAAARAHRLASRAAPVVDGAPVRFLRQLAQDWGVGFTPVLVVARTTVTPQVVGLLRPTILLPGVALAGMRGEELELILRHELAHVRRYDLWANLLQRLAEALLFFNPAVWLLSRRASRLREYCCDEMACAVDANHSPEPRALYAAALLRVVELSRGSAPTDELVALAANGRPSELRRRVARLLGEPLREPLRLSRGGALAVMGIAILLAAPLAKSPAVAGDSPKQAASEARLNATPINSVDEEIEILTEGPDADRVSTISIRVLDEAGQPIKGAKVRQNHVIHDPDGPRPTKIKNHNYQTDADGWASVTWEGESKDLRIWASAPGRVFMHAMWAEDQADGGRIPNEFVFKLLNGVEIGGRVTNTKGEPVAGATVEVIDRVASQFHVDIPGKPVVRPVRSYWGPTATTDADGRWSVDTAPQEQDLLFVPLMPGRPAPSGPPLVLNVTHERFQDFDGERAEAFSLAPSLAALRDKQAEVVLYPADAEAQGNPLPTAEQEPFKATAASAPLEFRIIIAKHVLLLNGEKIVTWDGLKRRMLAAPDPKSLHPSFYVTRGWRELDQDEQAASQAIFLLRKEVGFNGHSIGNLWPRTDLRYDRIRTADDLTPPNAEPITGTVVDAAGNPAPGAQVLLITPIDESIRYRSYDLALVDGRVRNPLEHVITTTDAAGAFRLAAPRVQSWRLIVLHPAAGFADLSGEQLAASGAVRLMAWGELTVSFQAPSNLAQAIDLTTRTPERDTLPEVVINQYWSDRGEPPEGRAFVFPHVPPYRQTSVQRSLADSDGGATSLHEATVNLLPGDSRWLGLGPISAKQSAELSRTRELLNRRRSRPAATESSSDADAPETNEPGSSE
ncbi:Methicillin resistance mecR1 protein [Posidoniimonas corsicana]|uniref:Methicillin resistance mecR1 protein n=1 Tax=Posidoniimonas corsicana TaxID=1938618 RepID=A0A5C5VCB9_9BACT|nr:M56 family metallopeptidase [Posidoniimonas corsicana]TWT35617.1 Methicillin resistance mecR1 protein [Posidoniimonas corsicana]